MLDGGLDERWWFKASGATIWPVLKASLALGKCDWTALSRRDSPEASGSFHVSLYYPPT